MTRSNKQIKFLNQDALRAFLKYQDVEYPVQKIENSDGANE